MDVLSGTPLTFSAKVSWYYVCKAKYQDVLNTLDMRFLNLTHGISVCKPCPANATVGFVYGDVDIFNSLAKAMAMGLDIIGLTGTGQHTGFLP